MFDLLISSVLYIDGVENVAHFENKPVCSTDTLPGKMHDIPFISMLWKNLISLKLMSTYGTNEL